MSTLFLASFRSASLVAMAPKKRAVALILEGSRGDQQLGDQSASDGFTKFLKETCLMI